MSSTVGHRAITEEVVAIVSVSDEGTSTVMGMEGGTHV